MVANYGMYPYGMNPYGMSSSSMSDDFMYNAALNSNPQQAAMQQAAMQGYQQPQVDSFQKQGTGLDTGLKLAAVGGAGAGAGAYFFGDKLGTNFLKDGKFSDDVLKAVDTNIKEVANAKALEKVSTQQNAILRKYSIADGKTYEAIKEYVSATDRTKLPKGTLDLVPDYIKRYPDIHKSMLFNIDNEFSKIDIDKIAEEAKIEAQKGNFAYQQQELANLTKRKSLLEGLAKDAKPAQIEELIKNNPKVFGIEATEAATIEAEAKSLAGKYVDRAVALAKVTPEVTATENSVKGLRTALNKKVIKNYWDDTTKAFKAGAPEELTKAAKNFKIAKAGKYGAIAAGVGLVLGWMFGK